MAFVRAFFLGIILLLTGFAGAAYAAGDEGSVAPADRNKVLGPGDIVRIEILEDKTAPVAKRVTDTGDLDVQPIGPIHVAGKTCAEVVSEVTKLLEADYYYKATVRLGIEQINRIKAGDIGKIFISGDVKIPGAQEIPPGEKLTASGSVVKAGGGTQFADLRKVKVTRKNKDGSSKTTIVDVKAVLEQGKMEQDVELQDGDYIFVPRRLITF